MKQFRVVRTKKRDHHVPRTGKGRRARDLAHIGATEAQVEDLQVVESDFEVIEVTDD